MSFVRRQIANHAVRDWFVALVIAVIGLVDLATNAHSENWPGAPWHHVIFLVLSALPLGFRRKAPMVVALAAFVATTVWDIVLYPPKNQASFEAFLVLLAASYILGADLRGRRQLWTTALVAAVILPSWLLSIGFGSSPGDTLPALTFMILAWVVGYTLRRRKEQAAVERARADRLAFEEGRMAAEAVIEERSRIARELHDVVAHSLSLMVVQASAERRALEVGSGEVAGTREVLAAVEQTGREALVELRRLLGLLRRSDESVSRQPQPSLRYLDALVEPVVASGVRVEVEREGELEGLPPGVDLAAFRVVQEALTNVVKHATASSVVVRLAWSGGALEVEVTDDGRPSSNQLPTGGHGLIGMRERVAMYDGELEVGPRDPGPGFRVRVRLPVSRAAASAGVAP
ncbi:MAG TPA: sensor histidine kinase [Mycobacteriales bacterium]|nr:sensor histidine kinase [Mycobacteriales bacterium]